jgi:hypothetical protein
MYQDYNKYTAAPVISLASVTVTGYNIPLPIPDMGRALYCTSLEIIDLPSGVSVVRVHPQITFNPPDIWKTMAITVEYHVRRPWDSLGEADQVALVTAAYGILGHQLGILLAAASEAPPSPYIPLAAELRTEIEEADRSEEDWTGKYSYLEKLTLHEIDYM